MPNSSHPDDFLKSLLSLGPRSQKVVILEALHEICRLQHSIPNPTMRDFSIPSIGQLCEAKDLFKARILYNAASRDYVALIKAWETFSGSSRAKVPKAKAQYSLGENAFLMKIDDFAIRQRVQAIISERDYLLKQVNVMKSQSKVIINQRPLGATIAKGRVDAVLVETRSRLTASERDALRQAVSEEALGKNGFAIGDAGSVISEKTRRIIFDPGFVTGISRILGEDVG